MPSIKNTTKTFQVVERQKLKTLPFLKIFNKIQKTTVFFAREY